MVLNPWYDLGRELLEFCSVPQIIWGALDLLHGVKTATLKLELYLGEEEKVAGSQIRRVGWVGSNNCVGAAQKFERFQHIVSRQVLMLEHPVAIASQSKSFSWMFSLNWPKWHVDDVSHFTDGDPTILTHYSFNFLDIFRGCACWGSPWPLVILQWRPTPLEARVPLKTIRSAHCFIIVCLLQHFKCLRCRSPEFDTEFDVCFLLKFEIHTEIAIEHLNIVTKMHAVQKS